MYAWIDRVEGLVSQSKAEEESNDERRKCTSREEMTRSQSNSTRDSVLA